jgi:type IV pilus assembly protein PilC
MLFHYKYIDQSGAEREGDIDALNKEVAISALQRRGLVVSSIKGADEGKSIFHQKIEFLEHVNTRDLVILSRQISTLFSAQVSTLKIFTLLASETDNPILREALSEIASDLQGGSSVSKALEKHSDIFSPFYVNMVKAGEESGRLSETFSYLSDYLDRTYELTTKAKNALVYPAFVVFTFIAVMVLMLVFVIPKISAILEEVGQDLPFYTKIVLATSAFLVDYGIFLLVLLVVGSFFLMRYIRTKEGKKALSMFKLSLPYIGSLYQKLYLSRLADNMNTMLISGIPMVRAIEITAKVIDNDVYHDIMMNAADDIRGGEPVSMALDKYEEIPNIMVQMIKVGEETGKLGKILKTLSDFYRREVSNAVDTLVSLIEPVMIVLLGVGVGFLLASVLIPIYNISAGIA